MSESEFRDGAGGRGEPGGQLPPRQAWRLPLEMPRPGSSRESRVLGRAISITIHALILLALLMPALLSPKVRAALATGAGGEGPAGGGGGLGGAQGARERVRYIRVSPPTVAAPAPAPAAITPPPVVPPKPAPEKPAPQPQASPTPAQATPSAGAPPGSGDASGNGGAGPGTGGGIGAGVGTGIGNANGPGTGGGADTLNPPFSLTMLMPPQPVPNRLKQRTIGVDFDIDSTGQVLNVKFDDTPDGGYNRKIRETAKQFRFRPATRRDGRPVRAIFHVDWLL